MWNQGQGSEGYIRNMPLSGWKDVAVRSTDPHSGLIRAKRIFTEFIMCCQCSQQPMYRASRRKEFVPVYIGEH